MNQKLFRTAIALFFVVVTIVIVAMIGSALLNNFYSLTGAHTDSIYAVSGGISEKQIAYMIIAASLIVAGFYVFFRRGRFRR